MHRERNSLRRSKRFVLGPDIFHLDWLARHLERRQFGRCNEVAEILPHDLVRRLPVHRHARGHGFGCWLEPLYKIFADAAAIFIDGENVAPYVLGDLHGTFHEEVPQVGEKTAGQRFLGTTEARRSLPFGQSHLGWRRAWITPLWRNGAQRYFCLTLLKIVSRSTILSRREWMPSGQGGLTHCQIHCNIGTLPRGSRFPNC